MYTGFRLRPRRCVWGSHWGRSPKEWLRSPGLESRGLRRTSFWTAPSGKTARATHRHHCPDIRRESMTMDRPLPRPVHPSRLPGVPQGSHKTVWMYRGSFGGRNTRWSVQTDENVPVTRLCVILADVCSRVGKTQGLGDSTGIQSEWKTPVTGSGVICRGGAGSGPVGQKTSFSSSPICLCSGDT